MLVALVCSLNILAGATAFFKFDWIILHVSVSMERSSCNSAVFLPSAAVRTITPKFFGLMASTIFCRRLRSSEEWIFLETATISLKGVITTKRPGKDISQLKRGPLAAIGSFKICTNMFGLPLSTSLILPVLIISGSTLNLAKSKPPSVLSFMASLVNFKIERT